MKPKFNIYICSDQHWNHGNINKLCDRKFQSLKEMNDTMIARWNKTVRPQDIVINLGDIIFTKGESSKIVETLKKLNGRKILVKGNHDRKSYHFYLCNGISFVCERFEWYYTHKKILFLHDPNKITLCDLIRYDYIIHGHYHNNVNHHNKGKMVYKRKNCILINVSVEHINYTPISLIKLLHKLNKK